MAAVDPAAIRVAEQRIAAAHKAGLPTSAAVRLQGDSVEELEADAAFLASELGTIKTGASNADHIREDGTFDADSFLRSQVE